LAIEPVPADVERFFAVGRRDPALEAVARLDFPRVDLPADDLALEALPRDDLPRADFAAAFLPDDLPRDDPPRFALPREEPPDLPLDFALAIEPPSCVLRRDDGQFYHSGRRNGNFSGSFRTVCNPAGGETSSAARRPR
jgi:hypothetical protein